MLIKQNLMLLILLQLQVQLWKLLIRCHWQLDQVGVCFVLYIRSVVTWWFKRITLAHWFGFALLRNWIVFKCTRLISYLEDIIQIKNRQNPWYYGILEAIRGKIINLQSHILCNYYMANPVLGKSLCSDWFFLGQDFAVRTVSMETVQSVYFCFGPKPPNSTFATKTAKKKCENCHSSHWKYQQKLKRLKFFQNFKDGWRRQTFFKCKPPDVHFTIRNRVPYHKLLTNRACSGLPGNIGCLSFLYGPCCTWSTLSRPRPIFPSTALVLG